MYECKIIPHNSGEKEYQTLLCTVSYFRFSLSSLRWNQLDLAIVLLSVMGITLEEIDLNASLPINPTIIRIMRVLRIARGTGCRVNTITQTSKTRLNHSGIGTAAFVSRGKFTILTSFFHSVEAAEDGHRNEIFAGHSSPGFTPGQCLNTVTALCACSFI